MLCPKCGAADQATAALQCSACNVVFSKVVLKCPRCNHNAIGLEIVTPGVCPECGADVAKFLQQSNASQPAKTQPQTETIKPSIQDTNEQAETIGETKRANKALGKWGLYSLAAVSIMFLVAKNSGLEISVVTMAPLMLGVLIWQLNKRNTKLRAERERTVGFESLREAVKSKPRTITRAYKGSQSVAFKQFSNDLAELGNSGYSVAQQTWIPGAYTTGQFIVALLLCVVLIGILVFIYMLFVKPAGTLTVTYQLSDTSAAAIGEQKTCPKCAEIVKAAASVCRYCGHQFAT